MPDLAESLQGRDLGHLHIIAMLWGIDLEEQDTPTALRHLVSALVDSTRVEDFVNQLPPDAKAALNELARHAGRLPWAQFSRQYGELREMGVAKRDRERPYEQPASLAEVLWYRGLIARAFFDSPSGPEEYAYIPDELLKRIPHRHQVESSPLGRQASAAEHTKILPANDRILDHSCTLLAALRMGLPLPGSFSDHIGEVLTPAVLTLLLSATGLLDEAGLPLPEPVRLFLESDRGEALAMLVRAWMKSSQFNELKLVPSLSMEGNWVNDPLLARHAILDYLRNIPSGIWWSLDAFIAAIKQRDPDFQRPAGDYDAWFIRSLSSGEYLRGFEHWEDVDGRLVRYLLTGPLHWLGILDLAVTQTRQEVTAFRLSTWSAALLDGKPPGGLPTEEDTLTVRSDARLSARRLAPRRMRYQLARFCDWSKETPDEYQYQVSAASLRRARQQGLTISQLLGLLNKYAKTVPPSLVKALERWDKNGSEARMEKMEILRVNSAEVLQALRKSRASRFLGEPLGPTVIAIKPGATQKVLAILVELGYLGEIRGEVENP